MGRIGSQAIDQPGLPDDDGAGEGFFDPLPRGEGDGGMGGWLRLPLRDGQPFYLCPRRRANHGEVGSGGVQAVVGESAVVALQVNAGKVPLEQEGPAGSAAVIQPDAPRHKLHVQRFPRPHGQSFHKIPVSVVGAPGHPQKPIYQVDLEASLLTSGIQHIPAPGFSGNV